MAILLYRVDGTSDLIIGRNIFDLTTRGRKRPKRHPFSLVIALNPDRFS